MCGNKVPFCFSPPFFACQSALYAILFPVEFFWGFLGFVYASLDAVAVAIRLNHAMTIHASDTAILARLIP